MDPPGDKTPQKKISSRDRWRTLAAKTIEANPSSKGRNRTLLGAVPPSSSQKQAPLSMTDNFYDEMDKLYTGYEKPQPKEADVKQALQQAQEGGGAGGASGKKKRDYRSLWASAASGGGKLGLDLKPPRAKRTEQEVAAHVISLLQNKSPAGSFFGGGGEKKEEKTVNPRLKAILELGRKEKEEEERKKNEQEGETKEPGNPRLKAILDLGKREKEEEKQKAEDGEKQASQTTDNEKKDAEKTGSEKQKIDSEKQKIDSAKQNTDSEKQNTDSEKKDVINTNSGKKNSEVKPVEKDKKEGEKKEVPIKKADGSSKPAPKKRGNPILQAIIAYGKEQEEMEKKKKIEEAAAATAKTAAATAKAAQGGETGKGGAPRVSFKDIIGLGKKDSAGNTDLSRMFTRSDSTGDVGPDKKRKVSFDVPKVVGYNTGQDEAKDQQSGGKSMKQSSGGKELKRQSSDSFGNKQDNKNDGRSENHVSSGGGGGGRDRGRKGSFGGLPEDPDNDDGVLDYTPHETFIQMDELTGFGKKQEWRQTARWIKYEENVEPGGNRWGRPHVATLDFEALMQLRKCLESGIVLLDLEECLMSDVIDKIVFSMIEENLITEEHAENVVRVLQLEHRHVDRDRTGPLKMVRRNTMSYIKNDGVSRDRSRRRSSVASVVGVVTSLGFIDDGSRSSSQMLTTIGEDVESGLASQIHKEKKHALTSVEEMKRNADKDSIWRKIPDGAQGMSTMWGSVDFLKEPTAAFIRLAKPTQIQNLLEVPVPVRFIFIILGPVNYSWLNYEEIGRAISTLMATKDFQEVAYTSQDRQSLLAAISEVLGDSIVLPLGEWDSKTLLEEIHTKSQEIRKRKESRMEPQKLEEEEDEEEIIDEEDPLQRSGKLFGGLVNDIKRRYPYYISDFKDAFNSQCLASVIFIYFAALSGAITFGGLMSEKTNELIGIPENMVCTAVCGILFSLLAGQPLVIIACTGPLLLFDESLFSLCETNGVDFLAVRVWVGLWLGVIALVLAAFEGSVFVKRFTRFSQEIFASLISLLFIYESFYKLYQVFREHPLLGDYCSELQAANSTNITDMEMDSNMTETSNSEPVRNQPNTALLSTILMLGTFFIAYSLRQFRNSNYLGRGMRRALGDFGAPIAIVAMVAVDYSITDTYTQKLNVPTGLQTTVSSRGWIISPLGVTESIPAWVPFAALLPALLIFILLFMETHICELIIDKRDGKMKKGSGFHLDIVIICLMNIICGFLGAPFVCAATVRAVSHVASLTVMSTNHAPGETPKILEIKEQRLTSLVVSIMIGVSVLMSPLLKLVPMAVLFGIFLYMGFSSTSGIQFFERLILVLMPIKHYPPVIYVKRVETVKMHFYTFIQLVALGILWAVKSSNIALAFPFFLLMLLPLRKQLGCVFTEEELGALEGTTSEKSEEELDFYEQANSMAIQGNKAQIKHH